MKILFIMIFFLGALIGLLGGYQVVSWQIDHMVHETPTDTSYEAQNLKVVTGTVNWVNDGDAWDIQPAGGYRLLTPLATAQYYVFNQEYYGSLEVAQ